MAAAQRLSLAGGDRRSSLKLGSACRAPRSYARGRAFLAVRADGMGARGFSNGDVGIATLQGTSRFQNEDRCDAKMNSNVVESGPVGYVGVFDGHGGFATSDWLKKNMAKIIADRWNGKNPAASLNRAFTDADVELLSPKKGFLGMVGERGVGGSKCGSTGAVAMVYEKDGALWLATANAGDARIVMCRGGSAIQLTEDHVPDNEEERLRIESYNPNPKMPLVKYVGGTWRVGGLLALSRAFGDAYMKPNLEFEGLDEGSDYSTGFGVVATPFTQDFPLSDEDEFIIAASDGLFENYERGGGGGISNQAACDIVKKAGAGADLKKVAMSLCQAAVDTESTDDITVVVLRF